MARKLERKLRKTARQRGYGRAQTGAYVYGAMESLGWKPKRKGKR